MGAGRDWLRPWAGDAMFGFLKDLFQSDTGKTPGKATGAAKGKGTGKAKSAAKAKKGVASGTARDQAMARIRENQARVMTPERAELIRKAMEVRRAKQQILADLSDEQRQKLAVMAIRAFLNEGKEDKK